MVSGSVRIAGPLLPHIVREWGSGSRVQGLVLRVQGLGFGGKGSGSGARGGAFAAAYAKEFVDYRV